jgi:cbb3-type cytochrome oxidase maturation protein
MNGLLLLIPIALALGAVGLMAFLWAMNAGQFDDLDGAAGRILFDDDPPSQKPGGPNP